MNKGVPISEFAAASAENAAVVEKLFSGLKDGSISMCACMGPTGDDPHCPCDMRRRGLVPTNPWTPEKIAELHRVLDKYKPRGEPAATVERECNACNWRGREADTLMLGAVGPLCPECRETTERTAE
jgi:hypothetical protein